MQGSKDSRHRLPGRGRLFVAATTAALLLLGNAALADIVYNTDLTGSATIDAALEQLGIDLGTATTGTVSFAVSTDDSSTQNPNDTYDGFTDQTDATVVYEDGHVGCNINNTQHQITLKPVIAKWDGSSWVAPGSSLSATSITFSGSCSGTPSTTVTASENGTWRVSWAIDTDLSDASTYSGRTWNLEPAAFTVVVTGQTTQVEVCGEPAAPAWASYIIRTYSSSKIKPTTAANYVSAVAKYMGSQSGDESGTDFAGESKEDRDAYADAVFEYLRVTLNVDGLTQAEQDALDGDNEGPGEVCQTISVLVD